MGGRAVGLASAMILGSSGLFVGEMRQAGNDGPLAFFTTLALYAAWRLLDDEEPADAPSAYAGGTWRRLFYAALGLGFLCKGPIVLMLTSAAIVPYLIQAGRLRTGLRRLVDAPGLLIFAAIAASWPAAVAWHDPNAMGVWLTEMSEKTGVLGTLAHRRYALLARHWPDMMFPWSIVAMAALVLPFLPAGVADRRGDEAVRAGGRASRRRCGSPGGGRSATWGSSACGRSPSRITICPACPAWPCWPGMAWVRLARRARGTSPETRSGGGAGRAAGAMGPALRRRRRWSRSRCGRGSPGRSGRWTLALAAALAAAVVVSVRAWRRGADAMALSPIVAALGPGRARRLRDPRPGREPAAEPPRAGPDPRPPRPARRAADPLLQ